MVHHPLLKHNCGWEQVLALPVTPSSHERIKKDQRYPLKGWVIVPKHSYRWEARSCYRATWVTTGQTRGILKIDLVEPFNISSKGLKCPGVVLCSIQPGVKMEKLWTKCDFEQVRCWPMLHDEEPHGPYYREHGMCQGGSRFSNTDMFFMSHTHTSIQLLLPCILALTTSSF